jgi:hypothetical protein
VSGKGGAGSLGPRLTLVPRAYEPHNPGLQGRSKHESGLSLIDLSHVQVCVARLFNLHRVVIRDLLGEVVEGTVQKY